MQKVYKSFKYKLNPTKEQKVLLNKHFGCTRLIYNLMLDKKIKAYEKDKTTLSSYDLIKEITNLKRQESFSFLKEVSNIALQQSLLNLDKAYKNFFKLKKGFPKFKSKRSRNSYRIQPVCKTDIQIDEKVIKIPKFREGLAYYHNRPIEGEIKFATVSLDTVGNYWISITTETIVEPKPKTKQEVGIDLGISSFATLSDGIKVENPKFLEKYLGKLRYIQRIYSKTKGKRTLNKLRRIHLRIKNLREDFLHKVSSEIVSNYDYIAVEDLAVQELLISSNHTLSRRISDVGWGKFLYFLEYKSEWYGKELKTIGRFEASSKTCHNCKNKKSELSLSERIYKCSSCGIEIDRDLNASLNILSFSKLK